MLPRPVAGHLLTPGTHPPLLAFQSRTVEVALSPGLTFQVQEALFQRRPDHWAQVWPSSLALSRWLLEQLPGSLPAAGKELGCGVGLVSMTMAHLGMRAEGTDREPGALAVALGNAHRNALVGFTTSHLDWSEPEGEATQFMAASDVLYENETPLRLFALLQTAGLLLPLGRLLMGGPRRRPAPLNELVLMLQDQGYSHHEESQRVDWKGRSEDIDVHVLRRPA